MKKIVFSIFAVAIIAVITSCASNPGTEPTVELKMAADTFALNQDNIDAEVLVATISSDRPIAEWSVQVNLGRGGQGGPAGQGGQRQRPANQAQAAAQDATQRMEGELQGQAQPRPARAPFYLHEGKGKGKQVQWKWNGKTSREGRNDRIQSAMDYQVVLTVADKWGNKKTYEDTLSTDVLVTKDSDGNLRMLVSSIVFPPNGSDLSKVSEDDQRANRRVLRLVGNALKKYDGYAITLEGHSNPTTPPNTPAREAEEKGSATVIGLVPLSKDRAQAVADFLVSDHDVDASRLTVVGIGGERTVADWDDPDENDKNRRVEFILKK